MQLDYVYNDAAEGMAHILRDYMLANHAVSLRTEISDYIYSYSYSYLPQHTEVTVKQCKVTTRRMARDLTSIGGV